MSPRRAWATQDRFTGEELPPGLAAVVNDRAYGQRMADRLRNLVRLAEHQAIAEGLDGPPLEAEREKWRRIQSRLLADADAALGWAAKVARWVPREEWDLVPSVEQLRRAWAGGQP